MEQEKDITNPSSKLSDLVWEFNFRPDRYIHATWLAAMPDGELISKLVGKHRGAERIVQHLMGRLGLENQVFFNFSNTLVRMALWSGEDLERVILHVGAVFNHTEVQHAVTREDVERLRGLIGDEMYTFMQRRVPMIARRPPKGLRFPRGMELKKKIILAGMLCLNEAFIEYPTAVRKRLMIKLPKEWFEMLEQFAGVGVPLKEQHKECIVLLQQTAIEMKMGVSSDGQIRFS